MSGLAALRARKMSENEHKDVDARLRKIEMQIDELYAIIKEVYK